MNASIFEDIAKSVLPYAPTIASSLLGPPAGLIVSLLENLFGVTADKLPAVINSDPAAREKLQEFTLKHKETLKQYSLQKYQAEVDDRKSARSMQEINKDWILHALAIIFTLAFFIYLGLSHFYPDQYDKEVVHDLFGAEILILSFYFGSAYKINK